MNKYSVEEIESAVSRIWDEVKSENPKKYYDDPSEVVVSVDDDEVRIKMSSMYQAASLSFAHLKKLSNFFGTDNINDEDKFAREGCETCDYGSSYGFTLVIK